MTHELKGRPRLLDLYCCAGGCTKGYQRAGFYVVGVDKNPQPNYCGDEFVQADVRDFLHPWQRRLDFDAVHASPPCQFRTSYRRRPGHVRPSENLIPVTRYLLEGTGLPYVIENVPEAREFLRDPIMLCGSSFGLEVRRHRLFEATVWGLSPACSHGQQNGDWPQATNRENRRKTAEIGVWRIPLKDQKRAMGVDWDVTLPELSQMIPPAYTEHIGHYLMAQILEAEAVAP